MDKRKPTEEFDRLVTNCFTMTFPDEAAAQLGEAQSASPSIVGSKLRAHVPRL